MQVQHGTVNLHLAVTVFCGPFMLSMQVLYGLIVGAGCAFICSWTRLWNNVFKRTAALLVSGE